MYNWKELDKRVFRRMDHILTDIMYFSVGTLYLFFLLLHKDDLE